MSHPQPPWTPPVNAEPSPVLRVRNSLVNSEETVRAQFEFWWLLLGVSGGESGGGDGRPCSRCSRVGVQVVFTPRSGKTVTWYTCGPTVYDLSHLGHARYRRRGCAFRGAEDSSLLTR